VIAVLVTPSPGGGPGVSVVGLVAFLLNVVALAPADLLAAGRAHFALWSGLLAGLVCGLALALVLFLWTFPRLTDLPGWYVLGGYVFPPAFLALVGACAGGLAGAPRTASVRRG
jgi:hypothetical protein